MAESKEEIMQWLESLPDGCRVGITEGGLGLLALTPEKHAYEIGGVPSGDLDSWVNVYDDALELYHPDICLHAPLVSVQADPDVWPPAEGCDHWVQLTAPDGEIWHAHFFEDTYLEEISCSVYSDQGGEPFVLGNYIVIEAINRCNTGYVPNETFPDIDTLVATGTYEVVVERTCAASITQTLDVGIGYSLRDVEDMAISQAFDVEFSSGKCLKYEVTSIRKIKP